MISLATLGGAAFLAAALATYHEDLSLGDAPAMHNVCGPVGAYVARFLFHHVGYAAWLFVLGIATEGVRVLRGTAQGGEGGDLLR